MIYFKKYIKLPGPKGMSDTDILSKLKHWRFSVSFNSLTRHIADAPIEPCQ